MIAQTKILLNNYSDGALIRWYFNGWHSWMFTNRYEIVDQPETKGIHIIERFSNISQIQEPTSKRVKSFITVGHNGLSGAQYEGVKFLLFAETTQIYLNGIWHDIEIGRQTYTVRENPNGGYDITFTAEIKEALVKESLVTLETSVPVTPVTITLLTTTGTASVYSINQTGGTTITNFGLVSEYGMEYRKSGTGNYTKVVGGTTLMADSFAMNIPGLDPNTAYNYRAYVKVGIQEFYGDVKNITTGKATVTLSFFPKSQLIIEEDAELATVDYKSVVKMVGLPDDGSTLTINVNMNYSGSDLEADMYYRVNSLSWVHVKRLLLTSNSDETIPITGAFRYGDFVDVRMRLYEPIVGAAAGTLTATITGGTSSSLLIAVGTPDDFTITYPDA